MTDDNTQNNDTEAPWYGELAEDTAPELKDWITNKAFADPMTALQSGFNTEKLIGLDKAGRTVVMPKDENDVEGLAAFRTKLGVPDSPDGYELPLPEGQSEEFSKVASTWFHEAGVPKDAAASIAEKWNTHISELVTAQQEEARVASEQQLNALKTEWGDAFGKNSEFGRRGFQAYGSKAGLDENDLKAVESTIGTAKMLKLFHSLGESMSESEFTEGDHQDFSMTSDEAQTRLDEARKKRIAGDITEKEFMALQDKYGPMVKAA